MDVSSPITSDEEYLSPLEEGMDFGVPSYRGPEPRKIIDTRFKEPPAFQVLVLNKLLIYLKTYYSVTEANSVTSVTLMYLVLGHGGVCCVYHLLSCSISTGYDRRSDSRGGTWSDHVCPNEWAAQTNALLVGFHKGSQYQRFIVIKKKNTIIFFENL